MSRDSGERLLELDLHDRLHVSPALRTAARARASEEIVAEERGEDVREASEVGEDRLEAAALKTRLPEPVVGRSALGIGQHLVRLGDVAEALLRVRLGRHVGMELARERTEARLISASVAVFETPSSS